MSLREDVNKIYLNCLETLDPSKVVGQAMNNLDSNTFDRIFPIAFGKAALSMMSGCLDVIPSKKIHKKPIVVTLESENKINHNIDLYFSSHPTPNLQSIKGAEKVIEYLQDSGERDLVLFLISGGGSSLLSKPSSKISLNDKIAMTELLLASGCSINEINTVRKHVSLIKGGKLAEYSFPSTVKSFIISDVVNDDISAIASGPTSPDDSTYRDALNIIKKYDLMHLLPEKILNNIKHGISGKINETPTKKDKVFSKVENTIICSNKIFREHLAKIATEQGYEPIFLNQDFVGEARYEAAELSKIFLEKIQDSMNKKIAIISGGETVVKLIGDGKGGRNQEFALSFLSEIQNTSINNDWLLLSVGTDGIDGPTDAAGGLIDNETIRNYHESGIDIFDYLNNNDSYTFLNNMNSIYKTGATGTNVADIQIILIK